ncbi:translocation/assembly module TamB domain-containing protein [Gilvimarinus xylanilyticus]|uniref:Translocation/assembly module TamB domain-containing protein n=1 Tax=Gilvimarinus xylanilyticus TaxID=2944139 RepID=A0A9X2I6C3_9GAMM|nr:translocation/assembly module TamB domain-containing protein [Gilvimarinus xylanilyticus]
MIKRLLLRGLLFVVVLVMSLLCALTLLVATEPGTRWLLTKVREATGAEFTHQSGALLRGVVLQDVRYQNAGTQVALANAELRWHPAGVLWGVLLVDQLEVSGLRVSVAPSDETDQAGEQPFSWPDLGVPFALVASDVSVQDFSLQLGGDTYALDGLQAELSYGPRSLTLDGLTLTSAGQRLHLQGTASLTYPYALELEADAQLQTGPESVPASDITRFIPEMLYRNQLQAELVASGNITELDFDLRTAQPAQINATGHWVTGVEESAHLQAQLRAPRQTLSQFWLDYAAVQGMQMGGELNVEGWLDSYRADFSGEYQWDDYPEVTLQLVGEGDLQQLKLPEVDLHTAEGSLNGEAALNWSEGFVWSADAVAKAINPGALVPDWPGAIDAEFSTAGRVQGDNLELEADVDSLNGSLRGLAVQGSGGAQWDKERLQLDALQVSLGGNLVQANGHIGETLALDWEIKAPLLEQIDPAVGGQLDASGRVYGDLAQPKVEGGLTAVELHWQDYWIESLAVDSEVESVKGQRLRLNAEASGLNLAGTEFSSANLVFAGTPEAHQLSAELKQDDMTGLAASLGGAWDGETWSGQLQQLEIRSAYMRTLRLQQPALISAAASQASVEQLCLYARSRQDTDEVHSAACASGSWQQNQGARGQLALERLPLSLLRRWLKDEVDVNGFLHGTGQFSWEAQGVPQLNADFRATGAELIYHVNDEESDSYPIDDFSLLVQQAGSEMDATADLTFPGYGQIQAQLQAQMDTQSLQGELTAAMDSLSPFEALLPAVRNIDGRLDARADISGSFGQPQLKVDAELSQVGFEMPSFGVSYHDFNARVQGDQQTLNVEVRTQAGDGQLSLTAEAQDFLTQAWQVTAELKGEAAHVMNSQLLDLYLTPDIILEASPEQVRVQGSARVPKAHAVISTLPTSATKVSDDVVVVDAETDDAGGNAIPIYMDVDIALGDEVSFNAAGFKARLGGELSIDKSPERALYALGNINIINGRFQAYGQDLTIEKGTLSFQGPMDNPGLNVTATREVDDIQVGLIIGGTLQSPTSEIYSRPQQTESDAMSMLFTGKPISGASSGEASMLVNAVAKLGIKRGQFLADDIAGRFGLDELTIKSDDDVKDSSLWLGKYLTEDLYVHYAIGLFDSISTVGLTYFISDNLRLEAESGQVQSADLIFRMER